MLASTHQGLAIVSAALLHLFVSDVAADEQGTTDVAAAAQAAATQKASACITGRVVSDAKVQSSKYASRGNSTLNIEP